MREEGEHPGERGAGHAQREGDRQVGAVEEVDGVHERGAVEQGARPEGDSIHFGIKHQMKLFSIFSNILLPRQCLKMVLGGENAVCI